MVQRTVSKKIILVKLKKALTKKITVEAVYLFGSRARGTHHPDSDYDIAIVSSNFAGLSFFQRQQIVRPIVRKALGIVPIDVVCYTKNEFEKGKKAFLPRIINEEGISA